MLKSFMSSWEWRSEWSHHIRNPKYRVSVWQNIKKNQRIRKRIIIVMLRFWLYTIFYEINVFRFQYNVV